MAGADGPAEVVEGALVLVGGGRLALVGGGGGLARLPKVPKLRLYLQRGREDVALMAQHFDDSQEGKV